MIYPIVIYGSPILRHESVDVTPDYPEWKKLVGGYVPDARRGGRQMASPLRRISKNIRLLSWTAPLGGSSTPSWPTINGYS